MCKVKEQARAYHIGDGQPVRWYVMLLPSSHRGMATGLKEERERRIKHGESVFDYFAPSYVEVKKMKGKLVKTDRPLLYNYVFIRASVDEIFKLKQYLPQYNFLPKVKGEKEDYYPYLSDKAMENLKWIANSYSNVLPVYIPKAETLVKGDRIRITEAVEGFLRANDDFMIDCAVSDPQFRVMKHQHRDQAAGRFHLCRVFP